MKKLLGFLVVVLWVSAAFAQQPSSPMPQGQGSGGIESTVAKQLPISVKSWLIDSRLGVADTCGVDTVVASFQDNTPVDNYSIANSWTGNLGSPIESKIFFDRTKRTPFMLATAYDAYLIDEQNTPFFNTKTPFANLTYRTSLPRFKEEDYFRAFYSMNFNKYFNVGGLVNLTLGRGRYKEQTSRYVNGGFFASYTGRRYEAQGVFMVNDLRNTENGGLKEPWATKNGDDYEYLDIRLNNGSVGRFNNIVAYLNHRYSLGFERERKLENDSLVYDFVPLTSFIHTIRYENSKKRYSEQYGSDFYANSYFSTQDSRDSTRYQSLRNTLAVTLDEKFNTLLKFGLAAFVEHDLVRQTVTSCGFEFIDKYQNKFWVGGRLAKNQGKTIRYSFDGKVSFAGDVIGDFDIRGNINSQFRLWKDTITIDGNGLFEHSSADFLFGRYVSNHFRWDYPDLDKTTTVRVDASLSSQKTGVSLGFHFANIKNYNYFDLNALPAQFGDNLQVMAFDLEANLKFWKFHSDNKMTYQITSNRDILPLPDFAIYSNLYFKTRLFTVLLSQFGVSCRYHTAYYGNAYMPATGQFHLQNERKIGNYPDLNVYANFHLKRLRFYFQYAHLNMYRFGGRGYELIPYYPINPATFQVGLSWTFYN